MSLPNLEKVTMNLKNVLKKASVTLRSNVSVARCGLPAAELHEASAQTDR